MITTFGYIEHDERKQSEEQGQECDEQAVDPRERKYLKQRKAEDVKEGIERDGENKFGQR